MDRQTDRRTDRHALMEIVCVIDTLQMARQRQTTSEHFSIFLLFFLSSVVASFLIFLSFVSIFFLIVVLPHGSIFFFFSAQGISL
jgi:hypothetical protein